MGKIGVRELKEQTTEILRKVREAGETFEVTYHGRIIARLVPVSASRAEETASAFWPQWDRLTEEITARWPESLSAAEAIRLDRRDL